MTLQDWSYVRAILAGIAAIAAILIAWFQLSNLNKNLNASIFMKIFEIEFELNRRKERLSEIRRENEELLLKYKNKRTISFFCEKLVIKSLDGHRKEADENYLNVFDRLCFFVLKKRLDEEDFRLEYRDMLFQTIQDDLEKTFDNGTKFRNMVKLYNQWKDK